MLNAETTGVQMRTKRASRSLCGVYDCSTCNLFLDQKCPGCASGNLHILREAGNPCIVYECVRELGVAGCHECAQPSCRLNDLVAARCPLRGRLAGEKEYHGFRELLDDTRGVTARHRRATLPPRTAQRMTSYLRVAGEYARRGVSTVSSHQLGRAAGVRSSLVRRDLSELGHCGTPGRGYGVNLLRREIRRRLRLEQSRPAVWLGAARLAERTETQQALEAVHCRLVGVFDDETSRAKAAGLRVQRLAGAKDKVRKERATIAVLASEEAARAEVIQELLAGGIKAILNLTPVRLPTSVNVVVEQGDLGTLLFRLLCNLRTQAKVRSRGRARG
ncbi:MAG: redox-sensing transcriptional repressor Rex [Armatimonadota bacterium]|nr:MAG: redox-sensing transcriptional repressor Rex [Armatimonadota bacterium]